MDNRAHISMDRIASALAQSYTILSPWSDLHRHERAYYHKVLSLMVRYAPAESRIMDVGCGVGIVPLCAQLLGYHAEGMEKYIFSDKDSPMFSVGSPEKLKGVLEHHGVILHESDVMGALPDTLKERFDVVINTAVIEHVKSPRVFLENIICLLKQGGYCITMTPNVSVFYKRLRFLLGRSPSWDIKSFFELGEHSFVGHWREYTQSELIAMHEWAGLHVIQKKTVDIFPLWDKPSLRALAHVCVRYGSFIFPHSREAHIIVAKK